MKTEIKVPAMGESITEATIGAILKPSGSVVSSDDELLELETDKVNQVLYASQKGIVQFTVSPGEVVKIGQVIGYIDTEATEAEKEKVEKAQAPTEEDRGERQSQPAVSSAFKESSGTQIRKTKESFISEIKNKESPLPPQSHPVTSEKSDKLPIAERTTTFAQRETRSKMSRIRKVIASRLVESQQNTALLTTFNEVDLTAVIGLREKYKDAFAKEYGVKLGFMSFFVKATVEALQACPEINTYIDGEDLVQRHYYDIGIAVGTDRGLFVPVVRNCDKLTFSGIESAIEGFAKKAKEGKLNVEDLQGGGFTITNGGIYGSLLSTPILNPPQSGILGMHKIQKRPVVIDDQIVIRSMMYLALSYDHRVVDGKEAVTFLVHVKNCLEDPSRLLLGV